MKSTRTRAIVLRRTNYGEADRILQLLTPDGKIGAIARGVRREKSKLASGIELFAICEIVVGEGKGELKILTSSQLIFFYRHILEDYDRLQFGYTAIKLINNASESIDSVDWYYILNETFAALDVATIQLELIQTWFYLRYSNMLGYELSLYVDVKGKKIKAGANYRYNQSERGLELIENGKLNSDHIKLMRLIATKQIKSLIQIGGIDEVLSTCLITAREHASISD